MQTDADTHLSTNELRAFARRLNRMWTNIQLSLYENDGAAAMIEEIRP
jgi:hypothetical protein